MLKGYGKVDPRFDMRMPLSAPILTKIFQLCPSILDSVCYGFLCLLRIGEITVTKQSPAVLQLRQLEKLSYVRGDTEAIKVTFYSFKHHYNEPPLSVVFTRQPVVCPVDTLLVYLQFRGCRPGPLFQHGSPVTRSEFCDWLARAIKSCGLNPDRYKGHSFRIGAASHAAECGYSETQIRLLG